MCAQYGWYGPRDHRLEGVADLKAGSHEKRVHEDEACIKIPLYGGSLYTGAAVRDVVIARNS
jgi:hypothetical protein